MRQYFCLNWVLIDNLFDRSRDDQAKICWPATVKKLFWTGSIDQVHKKHGPREECSDMGRGNRTVFCTMYVNTVLVALRKQTWNKKINWLTRLTWDQAQFERFSYILSKGYRWNWPCPPECNFQSETKIEPDLRLDKAAMLVDKTTKNNFAKFVHCVQTKISVPSEGKCFCFCTPARPRMGRGEGTSDFKWQGWSHGGKTQNPIKSLGLPTKPPKHPRTIIKLNNRFYEMDAMLFVKY